MNTTKTLLLAAMTVISLGAGTAMAQDGGGATADYWAARRRAAIAGQNAASAQYGSSDRAVVRHAAHRQLQRSRPASGF